jgi:2-keto-4-pentenoate hydratase/2-oxohepta-3-ene-1,7-dioic acid hydratase in catechol pathway
MQIALLNRDGDAVTAVRQQDGSFVDLQRTMMAFAEMTGRAEETVLSPLQAVCAGEGFREVWQEAVEMLTANGLPRSTHPGDSALFAPIPRPNRILAIGRNYAEHAQELGNTVGEEPIVFVKASSCVVAPGSPIVIPAGVGRVDYEAELLVVIGKGGKHILEAEAMSHVAGYTVFNDVTAREKQRALQEKKHPWFLAKSLDTFGPMGPWLVTPDEIADPHQLRVSLTVNGEIKQDGNTKQMVFSIPVLIAFLSRWMALEPGDVIATGTPSGVGAIVPGDIVSATVEGIGTLTNLVQMEQR